MATPGANSAGTPFSGVQTSTGILQAQRVIDMAPAIARLQPDATPLLIFSNALRRKQTATNPKFNWLEKANAPKVMHLAADQVTTTDTTLTLSSTDNSVQMPSVYSIIRNMTSGELMLVTAVTRGSNTCTVVRAFSNSSSAVAATAIYATDNLLIIGSAHPEGADIQDSVQTQTVSKTNYTQIFRDSFAVTRTLDNSNLYGVTRMSEDERQEKWKEHKLGQERAFLFGEPNENTTASSTGPVRTTGGLNYWITTYREDLTGQGGVMTYADWVRFTEKAFRFGNQRERLGIASPRVISAIDQMAHAKSWVVQSEVVFGVRIKQIQTSHGTVLLAKHNLLAETDDTLGRLILLDMEKVSLRPFANADMKLLMNRQSPGLDAVKHEYLTECGLQVENEACHLIADGIATGAA